MFAKIWSKSDLKYQKQQIGQEAWDMWRFDDS